MRRLTLGIILAVSAPAVFWAQQTKLEEIVARVNNDIILRSELDRAHKELRDGLTQQGLQGAQLEQAVSQQSKNVLRDLIDQNLLLQIAKDAGMSADLDVAKAMEQLRQENNLPTPEALDREIEKQGYNLDDFKQGMRTRFLTQQVVSREVGSRIIITTEDLRTYYETNMKEFDRPAGVRLQEIVIVTEKLPPNEVAAKKQKAEEALAAIKAGGDFAETAQKYSEASTATQGGELGFFQKGELAKELEDMIAPVEKGQTTEIMTMPYGFVILKVEDKHDGGILSFQLAQDDISNKIYSQRLQPRLRDYLTKLRKDGYVLVNEGYEDTGAIPPVPTAQASDTK